MNARVKKVLSEAVDQILWERWDPIAVNSTPAARDEYRGYVPGIVDLLVQGADAFKLAQRLNTLERSSMSCVTNAQLRTEVAEALLSACHEWAARARNHRHLPP